MDKDFLEEAMEDISKDLKKETRISVKKYLKKAVIGAVFLGSFGLGVYLRPDKEVKTNYDSIPVVEEIKKNYPITYAVEKEVVEVSIKKESESHYNKEKIIEKDKVKKYTLPFYQDNLDKIAFITENDTSRIDISRITLHKELVKDGYPYHLPVPPLEEVVFISDKTYHFDKNGVSEQIMGELHGDIGYYADLMNSRDKFSFTAIKPGKFIIDKEKIDGKKEFYILAEL